MNPGRIILILIFTFLALPAAGFSCRKAPSTPPTVASPKPQSQPALPVATAPVTTGPASRLAGEMESAGKKAIQRLGKSFLPMPFSRAAQPDTSPATAPAKGYTLLLRKADHALAGGDYFLAEKAFREATRLEPTNLEAHKGLALTLSAADRYAEAAEAYQRIVDLIDDLRRRRPTSPATAPDQDGLKVRRIARHNQAVALCRTGELAKAQGIFQALADEDPSAIQYRFNLAAVLQARGQLAEALEAWEQVAAMADKLPRDDAVAAWWAKGQMHMELGHYNDAIEAYSRVTNLTPDDPRAWWAMSIAAHGEGSLGRSLAAAKRAVALAPKNDSLQEYLGDLYLDLHRQSQRQVYLDLALQAWRRSLEMNGRQPLLAQRILEYEKVLQEATGKRQPATGAR